MTFEVLDLRLFLGTVEQGSITRGAELVHLSLASASSRIAAMESAAGLPLLDRHRRGVTPTRQGELLASHAREIVGRHDRMRLELADLAGGHAATVTILTNSAGATLLTGPVTGFLHEHPDVDVDLVQQPSHRIVAALADGRAELGVLADNVELGRLESISLGPDPLVVVVHPGHRFAGRAEVAFAEVLDDDALVGYSEGSPLEEHLRLHAVPLGGHPRHRARFPDAGSVCHAVAAGVGIAVLPARDVADGLVGVPLRDRWAQRELLVACRSWNGLSSPARALATLLRGTRQG
ncbi:LysR family transcriptional regulator [Pseudonocardia sp. NPDC049635]|uniref:LysR family transcriptional regulator n=1 Tax=Pseudonocardia sp. NPDC049635 TaxID=3155506 RepID=UPI0033D3E346